MCLGDAFFSKHPIVAIALLCGLPTLASADVLTRQKSPQTLTIPLDAETAWTIVLPPDPDAAAIARTIRLFQAVAANDKALVSSLIAEGANPAAPLPIPPPIDFKRPFEKTWLEFYVATEPGFTPLMLASALGYRDMAELLLATGADPNQKTLRNKTFALWLAARGQHIDVMRLLMGIAPESEAGRTRIRISLRDQQAFVWHDNRIVLTTPVSTGKRGTPTQPGRYLVTNKYKQWKSTLYRVPMPYYLRLSCGDFGLHAGHLPGYPASHGCVRLPRDAAQKIFASIPIGTLVEIE